MGMGRIGREEIVKKGVEGQGRVGLGRVERGGRVGKGLVRGVLGRGGGDNWEGMDGKG